MLIPTEALEHFENAIYLPMIATILERDREEIEIGSFKFIGPYLKMIEQAEKLLRNDFKQMKIYFTQHKMKLNKLGNDGTFTEYEFSYGEYEDKRRYLNIRLRNRTEELMTMYFTK